MTTSISSSAMFLVLIAIGWYIIFTRDDAFHGHRGILTDHISDEYDYVIVGGGSAGSVMASRLSEDKDSKVLLLEAGGFYDESPLFHIPMSWVPLLKSQYDWEYYTEPQTFSSLGLNEQRAYWPRGRVLGGSRILNGIQYTRGSRYEYDEWARNGCEGWSYRDILPYFLKSEDMLISELKYSKYHNSGGPLAVSEGRGSELSDLYLKAGQEMDYKINDYNGADQEGFSKIQLNIRNGVRDSIALAFLGRMGKRNNLDVAIKSFVTKIEIKDTKATGVYYVRNERKYFVKARKEVIVSAGAINTPQILMLSGVGPKEHLQDMNISVIADLPVGNNLQDHQMLFLFSTINESISLTDNLVNSIWTKLQYTIFGTGPLSIAGSEVTGFFYLDESKRGKTNAEIQVVIFSKYIDVLSNCFNFKDEVANELLAKDGNVEGFGYVVIVTHPKSTGTIRLRSNDPFDYPLLDPKYLTEMEDVKSFIAGIKMWESFIDTPTVKGIRADSSSMNLSFCSQHDFRSDAYWECIVRHLAINVYHDSCTCKMGSKNDSTAAVEPEPKVKGVKGLRVVDASVFPQVTSGNTNAPVIMVAEKAADMIRGIDSVKHIRQALPNEI